MSNRKNRDSPVKAAIIALQQRWTEIPAKDNNGSLDLVLHEHVLCQRYRLSDHLSVGAGPRHPPDEINCPLV